jgi:YggT family protein
MAAIMRIISTILSVYMLVIFIRIMLTWIQPMGGGERVNYFLRKITDPYLDLFRGVKFLSAGRFDFSPVLAILVLVVLQNIALRLAAFGRISLGIVLALIVQAAWSGISFLAFLFIAIMVIRFIGYFISRGRTGTFLQTLDTFIQPLIFRVQRILKPSRPMQYPTLLGITTVALVVLTLVARLIIRLIVTGLASLPV